MMRVCIVIYVCEQTDTLTLTHTHTDRERERMQASDGAVCA